MTARTRSIPYDRARPPRRRVIRRFVTAVALMLLIVVAATGAFIGGRCYSRGGGSPAPAQGASDPAGYARSEAFTFLTLPEWQIVYSADEYARFIQNDSPAAFPYIGSAAQYWSTYDDVCQVTRRSYPFETDYHVMLGIIGASFTIENVIRSAYENTIGRLSEWAATRDTPEDRFAAKAAADYGTFMHTVPWYQFAFGERLRDLWTDVPLSGPHMARKWERRLALSAEYGTKAIYGWLLGAATASAYGAEDQKTYARVEGGRDAASHEPPVERVGPAGTGARIVALPRYEGFTKAALALLASGTRFHDIAGNDEIMVTAVAPSGVDARALSVGTLVFSRPVLTRPSQRRLALRVPVAQLHRLIPELRNAGVTIEHLYDY